MRELIYQQMLNPEAEFFVARWAPRTDWSLLSEEEARSKSR